MSEDYAATGPNPEELPAPEQVAAVIFAELGSDYGRGYADALEDQRIAAERVHELRRAHRSGVARGVVLEGLLVGLAWALGAGLAELVLRAEPAR